MMGGSLVILIAWWTVDLDSLCFHNIANATLESHKVGRGQCVCLGNDGNEIHSGTQTLHNFNIQRLQGVAGGSDEVEAGVNTEVNLVDSAWLLLLQHVGLVLVVEELNNWHP